MVNVCKGERKGAIAFVLRIELSCTDRYAGQKNRLVWQALGEVGGFCFVNICLLLIQGVVMDGKRRRLDGAKSKGIDRTERRGEKIWEERRDKKKERSYQRNFGPLGILADAEKRLLCMVTRGAISRHGGQPVERVLVKISSRN
jgi:hypothetical protein